MKKFLKWAAAAVAICCLALCIFRWDWCKGLFTAAKEWVTDAFSGGAIAQADALIGSLSKENWIRPSQSAGGTDESASSGGSGSLVETEPSAGSGQSQEDPGYQFSQSIYPYYAMLSAPEQQAYRLIYSYASTADRSEILLGMQITCDQLDNVINSLYYDHPELFWMESSYRYSYNRAGMAVSVTLNYNDTAQNLEASKAAFASAAQEVLDGARQLSSAVEKEKYVHDYLLDNVEFLLDADYSQNAYSALVNGESVCAGYARAFQYLLMELDIPCYYCVGYANENHAWNIVGLSDGYYNVDVSWDDPAGNPAGSYRYEYFNLTDAEIGTDHSRRGLSIQLPACNATGYGYDQVFGSGDPSQKTQKGGNPLSYTELGYSDSDVLWSLENYYTANQQAIERAGMGTHTFTFILSSEQLLEEIYDSVRSEAIFDASIAPAVGNLGINGASARLGMEAERLSDGYVKLIQTISLTATD